MSNKKLLNEVKRRLLNRSIKVSTVKGVKPDGKPHVYLQAVGTKEIERVINDMIREYNS
ncbi:MAG: hypothetical protein ACI4DV_08260 [Lachnospiraceae bacterium]